MLHWIKNLLGLIGIVFAAIAGVFVAIMGFVGLVLLGLVPWLIKLGVLLTVVYFGLKIFGVL